MRQGAETPIPGHDASRAAEASDIVHESWLLRLAPKPAQPYLKLARIDRPIGTWLLLFPCWWSLTLALQATRGVAETSWLDWWPAALFAIGALVMRAAGCTVNDLADRDFDAKVARTATRPLPSGQVSPFRALLFLAGLLAVGLVVLLQFNAFTVGLGVASLLLVVTYPFMKRITYWPQAWLGLTFNWGALMGWSAVTGGLDAAPLWLYAAGIAWTLGYDTIYAHQDKEDDALVGVKSTALRFGHNTKVWVAGFYGLATAFFAVSGAVIELGLFYYVGVAAIGAQFLWQVLTLEIDDPGNCHLRFKSNRYVGWILLAGILAAHI
jgi:4-hydroxybenzoate polyprenyltransferase